MNGRNDGTDASGHAAESTWHRWSGAMEGYVCADGDDHEARQRKVLFTVAAIAVTPAGVLWAAMYYAFGEPATAAIPFGYAVLTIANVLVFLRLRRFEAFRNVQQLLILALPFLLQLALGGFVGGSAVIFWSFIAVLLALLFGEPKAAIWWSVAYAAAVVAAAVLQPSLTVDNGLPLWLVTALFALNVGTVSLISFAVLWSFVTARRQLRQLEVAYLDQEMALRQSEKMATLGTLAAGVAHELNNPAAATQRASEQLRDAVVAFESVHVDAPPLNAEARELLRTLESRAHERAAHRYELDALERSDRESDVEDWLRGRGINESYDLAVSLVEQGLDVTELDRLAETLAPEPLAAALVRVASALPVYRLVHEIGEASGRVSEIVTALKSYSFLGQAPVQAVDLREGLDSTLVILRSKLKEGVAVHRDYCEDLPLVPAYGSELNQVWTNLLDNAIDAMGGHGTITIRTRRAGNQAVVEIEDDGPGIPDAVKTRVFDPFFTTKEPGRGTGLGLSTSFSIVTEKHHGRIGVESRPGRTCFTVTLPLEVAGGAVE